MEILITIDGKIYRPDPDISWLEKEMLSCVKSGDLEEVKEKSEVQKIMEKLDQALEDSDCICKTGIIGKPSDKSEENKELTDKCDTEGKTLHATDTNAAHFILEKLREKIIGLKNSEAHKFYGCLEICTILLSEIDFLTSLETPQFTPGQKEPEEEKILDKIMIDNARKELWTPTPGQEEKWYIVTEDMKASEYWNEFTKWFTTESNPSSPWCWKHTFYGYSGRDCTNGCDVWWGLNPPEDCKKLTPNQWYDRFARPIEDKIELPLYEAYPKCTNFVMGESQIVVKDRNAEQIEALTNVVRKLIKQN